MIWFGNPCGPAVCDEMKALRWLGVIDTPLQGNDLSDLHTAGVLWCADNGCFSAKWEPATWWAFLERKRDHVDTCAFATAPDVVGSAAGTYEKSMPWLEKIRSLGYPVAYVAQDGLTIETTPFDHFDVLFLGGSTEFKLGPQALELSLHAGSIGKWVHMGRVNSGKRYRLARDVYRCDSADGTFLTYGPVVNLPRLLRWPL